MKFCCRSDGEKVITFLIDEEMRSPLHSLHSSTVGIGEGNIKTKHGIEGIAESLMSRASMQQNLKCITNSLSAAVTDLIPHSGNYGHYHVSTDEVTPADCQKVINQSENGEELERGDMSRINSQQNIVNKSLDDINIGREVGDKEMGIDQLIDEPEDLRQDGRYTVMADSTCQGSTGNSNTPVDQKSPELESGVIDCSRQGHNALGLLSDIADALHRGQSLYRDVRVRDVETIGEHRSYRESVIQPEHVKEEQEPGEISSERNRDTLSNCSVETNENCHSVTSPATNTVISVQSYGKANNSTVIAPHMSAYLAAAYNAPNGGCVEDSAYSQSAADLTLLTHRLQSSSVMSSPVLLPGSIPTASTMAFQQQLQQLGMSTSVGSTGFEFTPSAIVKQATSSVLSPLFMSPLQAAAAAQYTGLDTAIATSPQVPMPASLPTSVASHLPVEPVASHSRTSPSRQRPARGTSTSSITSAATTVLSKIPSGNKKWQCMFCGIMVSSKFYLSSHVNAVHTRTRVYPCELCGKVFYSHGAQRIHKLRNHWVEKRHKCPHCTQLFVLPFELRQHVQRKHKHVVSK